MADAEATAAINALAWSQGGVLACSGGWGEQTQRGATLLAIAASERARIREAASEAG